jgi:hypothetical protein
MPYYEAGEREIRTLDMKNHITVFKTAAFNRSAISLTSGLVKKKIKMD